MDTWRRYSQWTFGEDRTLASDQLFNQCRQRRDDDVKESVVSGMQL